jgi:hypothetical protein
MPSVVPQDRRTDPTARLIDILHPNDERPQSEMPSEPLDHGPLDDRRLQTEAIRDT